MSSPFQQPSSGGSRPFEARFPGICSACDAGFETGDLVRFDDDELVHANWDECFPASEKPGTKPCQKCFLVHAGDCF